MIQLSKYQTDNKVIHENFPLEGAGEAVTALFLDHFKQCNIVTLAGGCEAKLNKKGSLYIKNQIDLSKQISTEQIGHDKIKQYLLPQNGSAKFLRELGISGSDGKVFDRMSHKFKQINRFLEMIDDVKDYLPVSGPICVYDLCCGKSYLTFAVHYYLTEILHREVEMIGIDLKEDVIVSCNRIVEKLGLKGLQFQSGDIQTFRPDKKPDMILSLHACNTATDIVLSTAIQWETKIILSSPCCHHELAEQISCEALHLITDYGILKQKLCEISTDALRAQALKIFDYQVKLLEFVDPEDTPKNLMIRAVKKKGKSDPLQKKKQIKEYQCLCEMLNVNPMLKKLLKI